MNFLCTLLFADTSDTKLVSRHKMSFFRLKFLGTGARRWKILHSKQLDHGMNWM